MNRRNLLKATINFPLLAGSLVNGLGFAASKPAGRSIAVSRARPGERLWPSLNDWEDLRKAVDGRLLIPESPFVACQPTSNSGPCQEALRQIKNPFYIGDQVALTQTSGWAGAWTSRPSAYAVAAIDTRDVVAAVKFARLHNLRLVVKGGGHSYQGTSQAADSLLVWTRGMKAIELHDTFLGRGCQGLQVPQPAVTIGAGAMWNDAYDAVTTLGGRYVQGGGCTTVGVAGLIQSGGFGSFSKNYGCAAAGLLEAEIVTADGQVRIANACRHADLFWALKGGGGGSFGVITRTTLRTRDLPATFGAVFGTIKASSDEAYRELIARAIHFYQGALCNRHWGEQMSFRKDTLKLDMVFQGLNQQESERTWAPFLGWVRASRDYSFPEAVQIVSLPARHFWDAGFLKEITPADVVFDTRPGATKREFFWSGDEGQVGQFIHGFQSAWLSAELLTEARQPYLVEALFVGSRVRKISLHFNKGLAGAPPEEISAARNTAMNPAFLEAFALAICGGEGPPAYEGLPGEGPNLQLAREEAEKIDQAMHAIMRIAPDTGAYVSESNYFQPNWQKAFWGNHYTKLRAIKKRYDPEGLFYVWHGVGSEEWSSNGFERT